MNDLVILHLSDLHIEASTAKYSTLLSKLLNDIEKEITYVPDNSVVVAVTGDIIHKGDKNAVKNAIIFFKDLYDIIKKKVVSICIVPGNHDKFRTKANEFLIPAYRNMGNDLKDKFDDNFYNTFWKYQEETYDNKNGSGYYKLVKKIYGIFGLDTDKEHKFIKDTFGVNIIEVLGRKYCFVMLNTTWSCVDDKDSRQLILGQFQVSEILRQYNDLSEKDNISLKSIIFFIPCVNLFLSSFPSGYLIYPPV